MEIKQLKSEVIDKIAAGEVVERPSNLLKELIENSLDAKATKIFVEVDQGGKSITVADNGRGVPPEDFSLVFARHATSKIQDSEDLWKLSSFGFRGEALASISSVSQVDFVSLKKGSSKACRLESHFGKVGKVFETSSGEGTRVSVKRLFENIPARLKFLKSEAGEMAQIKNVLRAMALQNPQIEWKLKSKGQLVFFWPGEDSFLERAKKVLKSQSLYETHSELEGLKAHLIFSDPSNVVKVSRQIWIFVQNRWVQDRGLQSAVMTAYRSLLMHGQYPVCFVSLQCPPSEVDVNIHPTKSQVKFLDPQKAFRVVHHGLRRAVEKAPWMGEGGGGQAGDSLVSTGGNVFKSKSGKAFQGKSQSLLSGDPEVDRTQFQKKVFQTKKDSGFTGFKVSLEELRRARDLKPGDLNAKSFDRQNGDPSSHSEETVHTDPLQVLENTAVSSGTRTWSQLQVVGQIDLTYIVAQGRDRLVLVDQHAAHERVVFEQLMKSWKEGSVKSQSLLVPLNIDMDEAEVEALLSLVTDLQAMGVVIEQAGPGTLVLNSIPCFIKEKALVKALKKLALDFINHGGSFALETGIADIFATMACHSVVRAGQALSLEEMKKLLEDMDQFPLSGFCPHGRSVSLEFPFSQLERKFGRRK